MNPKIISSLIFVVLSFSYSIAQENETITISGKVTDFEGNPIDSAIVQLKHSDFSEAYSTYSDTKGNYELSGVKKGKYIAMYVIRPKEYPRQNAVPPKDMRLEYWAWNVVADRDLIINPRYHRLELYGLTAFRVHGSGPGLMVYVRPMSLAKLLTYSDDIYTNKERINNEVDISVHPENFKVKAFIDDEPVKINSIQSINEYVGEDKLPLIGYILHLEINKRADKPYIIIRIEGTNLEYNEKGENIYFYEIEDYE